jgi:hypothetical protein
MEVYYRVHTILTLKPTLIKANLFHSLNPYFLMINFIVIFPTYDQASYAMRFSNENCAQISRLFHACYMSPPIHLPYFDHCNNIWRDKIMPLLTVQFSPPPASRHVLSLSSKYSPQRPVLRYPRREARFRPPYEIIILYILITVIR